MGSLKHIFYIALKDLKLFSSDRGALFFAILFPLLFITMFSVVGGESEDPRLELHLSTQELEGGLSHQIIEAMETKDEEQLEPGEPKFVWIRDYDEARQMVNDKEIEGFLSFPTDFTEGVMTGSGTYLEVVIDSDAIDSRTALNGLAQTIATRIGSQYAAIAATTELLGGQDFSGQEPLPGQGWIVAVESLIDFETDRVGDIEAVDPSNWALPGYLVMFVFFTGALAAETIVRERQNNTLERLMSCSVKRESLLGGIFAGSATKGLIQISIFWIVGILAFNTDLGASPAAVIILSILMVIMSSAFGIMLATFVKTQRSAGSIAVLAALVLAPLGGCWWPLFILPEWMQNLAKITPHGWANTGFNNLMLFGADFNDIIPEMLVLVGFSVLFGTIAVWRFRSSAT